jgi:signal transduction histidine kinase
MAGETRKKTGKPVDETAGTTPGRALRRLAVAPLGASKRAAVASANGARAAGALSTRASRRPPANGERRAALGDAVARKHESIEDRIHVLERRAEAAERMLQDTVSSVSHDLRNPLMVLGVSARMLMRSLAPDAPGRKQLDAINRAINDIRQLAQDLVDAMNIDSGLLTVGKNPYEIAPIIDEALEMVAPNAALKPLEIAKELPSNLPPIAGDRERLVQVLAALVSNAMRFTPKGGRITVRAEPSGRDARFSISDTGPGIPSDQQPLLFARHAPARRPLGQGMGLAAFVTKGIVEAHGGTIWVESAPGQGSTFFFTIPTAPLSATATP